MNIPYKEIIELRVLKNNVSNSKTNFITKWFYDTAYNIQIKSIIRPLIKSKNYVNIISKKDIIDFLQFVYISNIKYDKIKVRIFQYSSHINYKCNMYFDNGDTIFLNFWQDEDYGSFPIETYTKVDDKTIVRTSYGINTAIGIGEEFYNMMIDIIIKYLKGEIGDD